MLRRALFLGSVFAGSLVCLAPAVGDEDMRVAEKFLQGLRDHQLYDVAVNCLEQLRTEPDTPADLKAAIDYEQGRMMLEWALKTENLVERKELLDQARRKIATFVKKHPKHSRVPEASMALGRLLVERGRLATNEADLVEARASLDQARAAFDTTEKLLEVRFKTFPLFISAGDPRKDERDKTHANLMDAQLQKALVDYEHGQTYEAGSEGRKDFLSKGVIQFGELYKKYRTQLAGLTARMWQGKCCEESGDPADIGTALGIYEELLTHVNPRLRPLQKHVAFFKIIAERKRGQYALAADDCARWLNLNNQPADLDSEIGLGVRLEKAKDMLAQIPTARNAAEKKAMIDEAVEDLKAAVRRSSRYKSEALALLEKYNQRAAQDARKELQLRPR